MTRQEHLDWCKQRALEILDTGDISQAYASMVSDLGKHPETEGHPAIQLGMMLMLGGNITEKQIREFIDGFN